MTAPPVITVRCDYCSKQKAPSEFLHIAGGVAMCRDCYEWHQRALSALAGTPPPGCQACNRTFQELEEAAPGGNVRMYVHPKDGLYQILCPRCSDRYVRKRRDLYGGTPFGREMKL